MMEQRTGEHNSQIVRAKENVKMSSDLCRSLSWATVGPATDKHQAPTHQLTCNL